MKLSLDVQLDPQMLERLYKSTITDKVLLEMHNEYDRMMSPYVPYKEGFLDKHDKVITPHYIEYTTPYAHYQYFLHDMNADLAGTTNRTRTVHKRPTSFWDIAFNNEHYDELVAHLQKILDKRVKGMR